MFSFAGALFALYQDDINPIQTQRLGNFNKNRALTLLFEGALHLMILHFFHRSSKYAACSGELTGDQSAVAAILQVVLKDASLTHLRARIGIRTNHSQLVEESEKRWSIE